MDSDTGESVLDVVRVPEGYSLQMAFAKPNPELHITGGYISVILDREQAATVADLLRGLEP